jgi:hypothetical protein
VSSQNAGNGPKQGAGNQFVKFSRQSAQRIAKAVRTVEGGNRDQPGITFDHPLPGGVKVFRVATFTGAWSIGDTKTVTFKYQTTTPNTAVATNLFCGLSPAASCDVSIAKDGTAWYLVQPNLSQLPGFSASGTQVMVVSSGNLAFVGTTAC